MKKLLITGVSGFVGGHFARLAVHNHPDLAIHGVSRSQPDWDFMADRDLVARNIAFHQLDLLDMDGTHRLIEELRPDYILHLASFSSVAGSWREPTESFLNNTNVFLNIIDSVRLHDCTCRVLSVGSSEEYGIVTKDDLPLVETHTTMATSPYGAARISEENLAMVYCKGFGLDVCCTRSFNHIGPGQRDQFVASGIVKQFVEISLGLREPIVRIGDGTIVRDFTDIDDVVRAYDLLLRDGRSGEIYNVCSGTGYQVLEIIDKLTRICSLDVDVEQEKDLMRPVDNPILVGSYEKAKRELGWSPEVNIEHSLRKMLDYWTTRVDGRR